MTLTHHAAARCRDRGISAELARREVEQAATAGRRAKAKPRWAWLPDHDASRGANARKDGTYRYHWNLEETRAYLCVKTATGWRVVTVLINYGSEAA